MPGSQIYQTNYQEEIVFEVNQDVEQEPARFIKKESVFKDYLEETKDNLKKMFEKDYKYSKINLMSNDDNFEPLFKTFL